MYSFIVPSSNSQSTQSTTSISSSAISSSFSSSATAAAATLTSGWTSLGCYNDSVNARTLINPQYGNNNVMTVEMCQSTCMSAGFILSGVEYGGECYCDNSFQNYGALATDGCTMACHGSSNEICGGTNRLNVYKYATVAGSSSSSSTSSSSSVSSTSTSTASGEASNAPGVQPSSSTSSSLTSSQPLSTSTTTSPATASSTMALGWYPLGCYVDSVQARTLANGMQVPGGANSMTTEACTAVCKSNGYTLAGTEYSGECYCDTAFRNGGGPAPDGSTGCNMPCNGNSSETCGGSNRLSVLQYYSGAATGTSSSPLSSTLSSSATTTSSAATGLPSGWIYDGCYIDNADGRIMLNQQSDSNQLTVESCVQTCSGMGYKVAGMEYAQQCFCDNYIRNGAALSPSDSDCGMSCAGNNMEKCGDGDRVSVYSLGNLTVYQPPTVQNTSLPGNWSYVGCLTDNADSRTFPYRIINMVNNNTATNCLSLCSQFGYPAGGMEYSSECYCGDFSNIVNANAAMAPATDCNMACSGDPNSICGGGSRVSYYAWTGSPLYSWNRPTGNAAGEYQFLIGGVVIPLITSQTIKGKVTFLEKFGTGAPNTTGAYELDLAQLNNFTAAWRPMHVKTDIFCSASLTLPDKAGRQINIGGWANDATYGIRLYSPDGSAGVAGVNDWQENVNEVSLQNGRWYPSAMIMANGSILVVGGEEGSNGAPVPTLELLPTTGGVVYCDWLDRTDPYNLYPFLAVLPSGGIFVAYYNEARILDEGTLQTSRTLPNIPGAVNDFLAGRTYPFEGTSVIMPQHAPYGDPLTIMICGGSTPGPEIALENCVSIQPEVTNANWTIERMPSQRVISCMTALPDGTYLILNGGQQGRAGFGLATNPNLNAVLYDPSQPVNQRMSVMANTTIDRLYHSEAILLQDGRVLVSGSDPEDTRFPQEYRVEVFVPPYLLSGAARPTFNVTKTDWAYGQSVTITITSGNTANMRASLLGAEASTHGNSMGQRTIFPAFSCSGNTCTITAPPNSHVCPPGWFQLFLLDGPTPSVSTYVRIGGDPASLGDWPNFSDFYPLPGV
ncbi:copper radical oxidase [Stipitochalara longipes BDJ]|nr:copper radical oxidase [Stipitochalara longipes BDJ]